MDRTNDPEADRNRSPVDPSDPEAVLRLFGAVSDRAATILHANTDWARSGERDGQYAVDVAIDDVCTSMLRDAGFSVLSEESGITGPSVDGSLVVVLDPLDGSTNAALGLPWCATALSLVVDGTPTVALVTNLRTGTRFSAISGRGAWRDDAPIRVGSPPALAGCVIAVNARPPDDFRPAQFRAMGATALDIAHVASGGFDGSVDFDSDRIGVWDYLPSVLVLEEAGGVAADALGRELVTLDPSARRRPVTAASASLLDQLLEASSR